METPTISSSQTSIPVNIQERIAADPEQKKLYDAAVEFQSLFINMMLKSMRATLKEKDDLLYGGQTQEIFSDMLYDQYSRQMSKDPKFNLAEQIFQQISPQNASSERARMEYNRNVPPSISGEELHDPLQWRQ